MPDLDEEIEAELAAQRRFLELQGRAGAQPPAATAVRVRPPAFGDDASTDGVGSSLSATKSGAVGATSPSPRADEDRNANRVQEGGKALPAPFDLPSVVEKDVVSLGGGTDLSSSARASSAKTAWPEALDQEDPTNRGQARHVCFRKRTLGGVEFGRPCKGSGPAV